MRKSFNAEEYMYNLKLKLSGGDFNQKNLEFDNNSNFAQFIQKEKDYLKNQTININQNLKNKNSSVNFQEAIYKDSATVNFYASSAQQFNTNLNEEFSLRNTNENNNNNNIEKFNKENLEIKNINVTENNLEKPSNYLSEKINDNNFDSIDKFKSEKESGQRTFNVNMNSTNSPKMFSSSQLNSNNYKNFNSGNLNEINKNPSSFNIASSKNTTPTNINQDNKPKKSIFCYLFIFFYYIFLIFLETIFDDIDEIGSLDDLLPGNKESKRSKNDEFDF